MATTNGCWHLSGLGAAEIIISTASKSKRSNNNDIISTSPSRQKLLDSAVCLDKTRLTSACLKAALAHAHAASAVQTHSKCDSRKCSKRAKRCEVWLKEVLHLLLRWAGRIQTTGRERALIKQQPPLLKSAKAKWVDGVFCTAGKYANCYGGRNCYSMTRWDKYNRGRCQAPLGQQYCVTHYFLPWRCFICAIRRFNSCSNT